MSDLFPRSTEYAPDVICPYCGEIQGDVWEYNLKDDVSKDIDCQECGKEFEVIASYSVSYSTFPKKES